MRRSFARVADFPQTVHGAFMSGEAAANAIVDAQAAKVDSGTDTGSGTGTDTGSGTGADSGAGTSAGGTDGGGGRSGANRATTWSLLRVLALAVLALGVQLL